MEEILNRQKAWKGDLPAEGLVPKTAEGLMGDLRWTNLGLVYKVSVPSRGKGCADEDSGQPRCMTSIRPLLSPSLPSWLLSVAT